MLPPHHPSDVVGMSVDTNPIVSNYIF